jgi:hypothetical protein
MLLPDAAQIFQDCSEVSRHTGLSAKQYSDVQLEGGSEIASFFTPLHFWTFAYIGRSGRDVLK